MRALRFLTALTALGALACSDPVVPDLNNPSLDDIVVNPTRAEVQLLATGLVLGNRREAATYARDLEILGRDWYNLDQADPRWITDFLIAFDPGGAFGEDHWGTRYRNVRTANVMLAAVPTSEALTDAEKSAANGFALTMKALELLAVAETRDVVGFATDAAQTTDELVPIACRDPGLTEIASLLQEGFTALQAGGAAFPFTLPSGFAGFTTPSTFGQFNRGIAARVELYRARTEGAPAYTRALAAVNASFINPAGDLARGVYHTYSLAAGDATNPLVQNPATTTYRVHPSVIADAEAGDLRVAAKTEPGELKTYQDVGSNIIPTVYPEATSPFPLLRNEELILLRAQAQLGLGNLPAAQTDINTIRTRSGGLQPRVYATTAAALDDLLRQKRYSLLFESGSRWIDARLYNRLNTLPVDRPNHTVQATYPFPRNEELARGGTVSCQ